MEKTMGPWRCWRTLWWVVHPAARSGLWMARRHPDGSVICELETHDVYGAHWNRTRNLVPDFSADRSWMLPVPPSLFTR